MARSNRVFKQAYNECLDLIALECAPRSISGLARRLDASRTTARRIIEHLGAAGIVATTEGDLSILRRPGQEDYFPWEETQPTDKMIETAFLRWVQREDIRPQTRFHEAELSRRFGVSSSALREFLIGFSRFGLIRKEPRRSWVFEGFTSELAAEVAEVRAAFELRAVRQLAAMPAEHGVWNRLAALRAEHQDLLSDIDGAYLSFPDLDARFHHTVNAQSGNRFIDDLQDLISIIFHYHYAWNRTTEKIRNKVAAFEHVAVIDALLERDGDKAVHAMEAHLATSRMAVIEAIAS